MTDGSNASTKPGVEDISNIFNHYRVSARAIWNTAFWPDPDFRNWDSIDRFHEIEKLLFDELVLAKIDREWPPHELFQAAIPFFHIVPSGAGMRIMIQNPRSERATGYWDHPVDVALRGEAELLFIAYFDWDQMNYIDLRYYRVKIASFDAHPEVVGRDALIDCQNTAVHLVNG